MSALEGVLVASVLAAGAGLFAGCYLWTVALIDDSLDALRRDAQPSSEAGGQLTKETDLSVS